MRLISSGDFGHQSAIRDPVARVRPLVLAIADFDYDRGKYLDLLLRAAETVLKPLGYDIRRLRRKISV